jgi:hypothetical protein
LSSDSFPNPSAAPSTMNQNKVGHALPFLSYQTAYTAAGIDTNPSDDNQVL